MAYRFLGANKLYLKSILQALRAYGGARTIDALIERIPEFVVLAQGMGISY